MKKFSKTLRKLQNGEMIGGGNITRLMSSKINPCTFLMVLSITQKENSSKRVKKKKNYVFLEPAGEGAH